MSPVPGSVGVTESDWDTGRRLCGSSRLGCEGVGEEGEGDVPGVEWDTIVDLPGKPPGSGPSVVTGVSKTVWLGSEPHTSLP